MKYLISIFCLFYGFATFSQKPITATDLLDIMALDDTSGLAKRLKEKNYTAFVSFSVQGSVDYQWYSNKEPKGNNYIRYYSSLNREEIKIDFFTNSLKEYKKLVKEFMHSGFSYSKPLKRDNITCVNANDHTLELSTTVRPSGDTITDYKISLNKGVRRSVVFGVDDMIKKTACRDTACINRYLLDLGFTLAKVDSGGNFIYPVYTYTSIPAGCSKLADSLDINTVRLAFNVREHIEFISFKTYCEHTGKYWLSWFESSGFKFKFSNAFGADVYRANFSFPADLWYYYERLQKGIKLYRFTLLYEAWD